MSLDDILSHLHLFCQLQWKQQGPLLINSLFLWKELDGCRDRCVCECVTEQGMGGCVIGESVYWRVVRTWVLWLCTLGDKAVQFAVWLDGTLQQAIKAIDCESFQYWVFSTDKSTPLCHTCCQCPHVLCHLSLMSNRAVRTGLNGVSVVVRFLHMWNHGGTWHCSDQKH